MGEEVGLCRGKREAIRDMCDAYGWTLSAQKAHLESLDLEGLEALRLHLKKHRAWPG